MILFKISKKESAYCGFLFKFKMSNDSGLSLKYILGSLL